MSRRTVEHPSSHRVDRFINVVDAEATKVIKESRGRAGVVVVTVLNDKSGRPEIGRLVDVTKADKVTCQTILGALDVARQRILNFME